jgi:hypothetical protein
MPSPRTYDALGAYVVVSTIVDAIGAAVHQEGPRHCWVSPAVSVDLLADQGRRGGGPVLDEMVSGSGPAYYGDVDAVFVLAVGSHIRVRDLSPAVFAAAANAAVFAVVTAEGPTSD